MSSQPGDALIFGLPLTAVSYSPPGLRAISLRELHASELYAHCRTAANPDFIASALPQHWLLASYQLADLGRLEQAAAYMSQVIGAVEVSGPAAWNPAFLAHANTLRQLLKARHSKHSHSTQSLSKQSHGKQSHSKHSHGNTLRQLLKAREPPTHHPPTHHPPTH